jgi:hypothetical protein
VGSLVILILGVFVAVALPYRCIQQLGPMTTDQLKFRGQVCTGAGVALRTLIAGSAAAVAAFVALFTRQRSTIA